MKKIILISGKAENGKTTAAFEIQRLLKEKGYRAVITRYAKYIKEIAADYCGWDGSKDEKGRTLLQQLGTEIIKHKLHKNDFNVERICDDIEIADDYVDYVIIDDVRYPNEIYYPIARFGKDKVFTYRVNRCIIDKDGKIIRYQNSLTDEQKKHPTETALDNYENWNLISFTSSLKEAAEYAKELVDKILKEE